MTRVTTDASASFWKRNLGWSVAVGALLVLFFASGIYSLAALFGATAWVRHTDEVRVKLGVLHATLVDAEVGARGYFLTGQRSFLAPYDGARAAWRLHLEELRGLTADNDAQQERLARLDALVGRELESVARLIAVRAAGPVTGPSLAQMDDSKQTMEAARVLLTALEQEEARLDLVRQRAATRRGEWTMVLFTGGAAASLVVVAAAARQRRRAEGRRLRTEEERRLLEDVFSGIDDGITLQDKTGRLIFANASAARLIGFDSVAALLGASFAEISGRFELLDEHGAPFPFDQLPSRAVLRGGARSESVVVRYRLRATGVERWSVTQAYPVRDVAGNVIRAINVFRDITAERAAEERRRFLLRAADELGSSLDYEATLAAVARLAVPALADWCAVDIVEDGQARRLATAHVDPSKVAAVAELERRYPSDPRSRNGVHEMLRTGQPQLMPVIPHELLVAAAVDAPHLALIEALELRSYLGVPLSVHGRVLGAITFAMAESRRVYSEDDLAFARALADRAAFAIENARLFREVEHARAETARRLVAEEHRRRDAEEQARFAETFVGMLGHDLRNPLNAILMTTQLLKRQGHGETAAVNRILSSARRMSNMVGQLLDLTRSRIAGGIQIDRKRTDLVALVSEVVDETRRAYPGRVIGWAGAGEAPAAVDRDRLAQVVSNLVGNALEHGDPAKPVTVTLSPNPAGAVLTVHNDGPPIPADLLPVLFEPFRRTATRGERSKGLGLGLFITEQIVVAHGGRVEVSSAAGRGTTFRVVLPPPAAENLALPARALLS